MVEGEPQGLEALGLPTGRLGGPVQDMNCSGGPAGCKQPGALACHMMERHGQALSGAVPGAVLTHAWPHSTIEVPQLLAKAL